MLDIPWQSVIAEGSVVTCDDLLDVMHHRPYMRAYREGASRENWVYWDGDREKLMYHIGGWTQKNRAFKPGPEMRKAKWRVEYVR